MTTARTSSVSLKNLYQVIASKGLPYKKVQVRDNGKFTGTTQYSFLEGRIVHTFSVTKHSVTYTKTVRGQAKVQVAAVR